MLRKDPLTSKLQPEATIEECLLVSNRNFCHVFQRILQKYDREFTLEEEGGALVDMDGPNPELFEQQMKDLFNDNETLDAINKSMHSGSSEDEDLEVKIRVDEELTVELHKAVIKAKEEVNWEEMERIYQAQAEQVCTSSSDEDGRDGSLKKTLAGSSSSISGQKIKIKRRRKPRKRTRSSMEDPGIFQCDDAHPVRACNLESSYCLSSENEATKMAVAGGTLDREVVLESSYYDTDAGVENGDKSCAMCMSDGTCNQSEEESPILDSSNYDSDGGEQ